MNTHTNYLPEAAHMKPTQFDLSGTKRDAKWAGQSAGRYWLLPFLGVLGLLVTQPVLAQENPSTSGQTQPLEAPTEHADAQPPQAIDLDPVTQAAAEAHQNCVNGVMSTQAKAQEKREQIQQQCTDLERTLVEAFPEDMRQLVELDVKRQIESVLLSLEEIETAVVASAEDTAEIARELAELEAEQQAQAQAEVDAEVAQAEAELADQVPPEQNSAGSAGQGAADDG